MLKQYIGFCFLDGGDTRFLSCGAKNKEEANQIFTDTIYENFKMAGVEFYIQEIFVEEDVVSFVY